MRQPHTSKKKTPPSKRLHLFSLLPSSSSSSSIPSSPLCVFSPSLPHSLPLLCLCQLLLLLLLLHERVRDREAGTHTPKEGRKEGRKKGGSDSLLPNRRHIRSTAHHTSRSFSSAPPPPPTCQTHRVKVSFPPPSPGNKKSLVSGHFISLSGSPWALIQCHLRQDTCWAHLCRVFFLSSGEGGGRQEGREKCCSVHVTLGLRR